MRYEVVLANQVRKRIERCEERTRRRIRAAIHTIAERPRYGPHVRRLSGALAGRYRYRLGGLRIIYEIDDENHVVNVKAVVPRGRAY
jgi:mRNA interferase RelE/StbE